MKTTRSEQGYAIGMVAGLTGLDPHTIRAWERRRGAVTPGCSPRAELRERLGRLAGMAAGLSAQLNAEVRASDPSA